VSLDAEQSIALRLYAGAIDHVLDVGQNLGLETGWKRLRSGIHGVAEFMGSTPYS
jgi:hypothetical protein